MIDIPDYFRYGRILELEVFISKFTRAVRRNSLLIPYPKEPLVKALFTQTVRILPTSRRFVVFSTRCNAPPSLHR